MFTLYLLALKFPVSIIIDESEFWSRLRIWGQQSSQRRRLSRAIADRCCLLLREPIKSPKVISISSGTILTCCACIHSIATDLIRWKNGPRSSYYTRTRHFSCDLQWTCAMTSACHSLAPKYVECNKNHNKLFPHLYAILVDEWNNSSLSRYFNKLIIYGRQRCTLLCHLISPTRAKGDIYEPISWAIDIIDILLFYNRYEFSILIGNSTGNVPAPWICVRICEM